MHKGSRLNVILKLYFVIKQKKMLHFKLVWNEIFQMDCMCFVVLYRLGKLFVPMKISRLRHQTNKGRNHFASWII